ncbi:hypothetical protein E2C01_091359 [Portunus trituberculatus]|uniref:Uncharacterized protein n=1 Tax=Portunus trituberculatus TaxID=210409 RepID=A0A5B7JSQ5_PORTR|nr:hypothetical protein [Portunus trituberculatus]
MKNERYPPGHFLPTKPCSKTTLALQTRQSSTFSPTPHTPETLTSAPTLAPHPTPIPAPTPAPIKSLSPIISVVPLTAQPPSPKAQRSCHHHKPHHDTPPDPP